MWRIKNGRHYLLKKMIFFDKNNNKIDRDKIVMSLPNFSGARNICGISAYMVLLIIYKSICPLIKGHILSFVNR